MSDSRDDASAAKTARTFIIIMGFVAMCGDVTYEGARGLVGPYLGLMGASAAWIGFAAGFGEFLGYGLRLVSGWIGQRTGAYWTLVLVGYGMNIIAVPGMAAATTWQAAVVLLLLERIGKAIRSPARSTLVSYAAGRVGAGAAFGLEEALDQIGAVSGPLLTAAVLWATSALPETDRFRAAFVALLVPAAATLALAWNAKRRFPDPEQFEPPRAAEPAHQPRLFYAYVGVAALLGLGFADWALIAFHAGRTLLPSGPAPALLYAGVMGVDAVAALAFGKWFDRSGISVLAASCVLAAAATPLLFLSHSLPMLILGACFWAASLGAQESIFKAAVAQIVPRASRSRAYGVFFAAFGFAWWIGSAGMGALYDYSLGLMVAVASAVQLAAAPLFVWIARAATAAGRPARP